MSNSSSSSNASLPPPPSSSSISMYSFLNNCFTSTLGTINITVFNVINILVLLPLYVFVLYLGLQRWRQQHRSITISHSDLFTYHMVLIELMNVFGNALICCGVHTDLPQMMMAGANLFTISMAGQTLFHVLTCVERYLAVVHPVTYLSLRKAKWTRIRNITVSCVWLLCIAATGLMSVAYQIPFVIMAICMIVLILIVVSFCSLSVLRVLIRPGPGEGGGGRQRPDQSKLKAFYTIMVILVALFDRFGGVVLVGAVYTSTQLGETERCGILLSIFWFILPSSLVLPLLFLQRAGKLKCCANNKLSGTDQIKMENKY